MIYNRPGIRIIVRILLLVIEIFVASYLLISGQYLFGKKVLGVVFYKSFDLYQFLKKE